MSTLNQSDNQSDNQSITIRELMCDKPALQFKVDTLNYKLSKQNEESDSTIQMLYKNEEILSIANDLLNENLLNEYLLNENLLNENEKKWLELTIREYQQSETCTSLSCSSETYSELEQQCTIDMKCSPDPLQVPMVVELTADEKIAADEDFARKAHDIWLEYKRDEKMNDATEQMLANV